MGADRDLELLKSGTEKVKNERVTLIVGDTHQKPLAARKAATAVGKDAQRIQQAHPDRFKAHRLLRFENPLGFRLAIHPLPPGPHP